MVKKVLSLVLIFMFLFSGISNSYAFSVKIISKEANEKLNKEMNISDMFIFFGKMYDSKIPQSYKYINVNIKGINNDEKLYSNVQKLIYVDILKNA
jgi:hypothetical protein